MNRSSSHTGSLTTSQKHYGTVPKVPPSPTSSVSSGGGGGGGGMQVRREIGLKDGISIIVGCIIGSGIFVTPRGVYTQAGSVGVGLFVWLASGLFSLLGAQCFMELGTSIGRSGGEYAYLLEAFGPLPAFLHLWVTLVVRQPTALAIIALAFAQYVLKPFAGGYDCEPPLNAVRLLAAALLCFVTYLNCTSVKWIMRVQGVFTGAKLVALLAIIGAGLAYIFQGHTENLETMFEGHVEVGKLALAFYSGLFSYFGWHFLNLVTEEMKDPIRNLPISCNVGLIIVTLIYVLVNLAYVAVLPVDELLSSPAVAVSFGYRMFGAVAWAVPVAVAISTIGSLNGCLFTSGRVVLVGAQDGLLPSVLAMLDSRTGIPTPAIIIQGMAALLMLLLADITALINYLSFSLWLTLGGCAVGLVRMRYTKPDLHRPLRANPVVVATFIGGCCLLLVLPLWADPINSGVGGLIIFTGLPAYWLLRAQQRREGKPNAFSGVSEWITRKLQMALMIVPSDPHREPLTSDAPLKGKS